MSSAERRVFAITRRGENASLPVGIDTLEGSQAREYLRELLIEVGLLPGRDKYLAAFEVWRPRRLASIEEPEIRREISIYLSWRHVRNLTVRAEAGRLTAGAANLARDQTDAAVRFLRYLSSRRRPLGSLSQPDVDEWFATSPNPMAAVDFLSFAMANRRCPRLRLPQPKRHSSPGSPLVRLREIVARLLSDENLELCDRVAGLIVVLFAQPVTRVVTLQVSDVHEVEGSLALDLGSDPVLLPELVAALVVRYLADRAHMNTVNTTTTWLFPGGRAGAHMVAAQLTARLNRLGITKLERQGALTHLVSEVPAAVVAKATGYAPATTAARAAQAGTDWASYVALKVPAAR